MSQRRTTGARAQPKILDIALRFARCQLVLGDMPTLIDAGTEGDVPRILAAIGDQGLAPRDIRRIILTHADGDHAGGAARLQAMCCPKAVAHRAESAYLAGHLPAGFRSIKRSVMA